MVLGSLSPAAAPKEAISIDVSAVIELPAKSRESSSLNAYVKSTSQPDVSALPPLKLYDQPHPGVTLIMIPSQSTSK